MKKIVVKNIAIFFFLVFFFNSCFKDELLKEIDDLRGQLTSMQKRNDSLNSVLNVRADSLSRALSSAQKRSDSLSNVLNTKSDSLSNALGLTNANLIILIKSVDSIKIQVATINGSLTQLNTQLTSITTQLNQLNQQLGALGGDVSKLAAQYQTLSVSLQTINTQITALQAEQSKLLENLNAILLQLNPPADITAGLVAFYPFTGNAGDSSGNANHGTVNGATLTTDRFNFMNSAYSFNGINNYIIANASIFPTGTRTVSFWFYANDINTGAVKGRYILGYGGENCGKTWYFNINLSMFPNTYQIQAHCNVDMVTSNYGAVHPNNKWINWTATTDINGTKMYIDGRLIYFDSKFINQTVVNGKKIVIGSTVSIDGMTFYNGDGNGTPFNGKIDDIRIYNRVLTEQEIQFLANN